MLYNRSFGKNTNKKHLNFLKKKVIQKKLNLVKLKFLKKKYKNFFQKKKFNFFFFLNKIFNSLSKFGKKNISVNSFFKLFNILKFKNNSFKNKSFFIFVYFLQIAIKLLPSFVYINKHSKGKTIILPWINKNKNKNKKKVVVIGSIWFKKALKIRKEKTFFLKLISEFENIRMGKSESINYKYSYYKAFIDNKRHIKYLKKKLWI